MPPPDLHFVTGNVGEKTENFFKQSFYYKALTRDAVYKTVLLSGTILAFSVSLFSTTFFKATINIPLVKHSWYFLFTAMVCGIFYLVLESRFTYTRLHRERILDRQNHLPKSTSRPLSFLWAIWLVFVILIFPTSPIGNLKNEETIGIRFGAEQMVISFFSFIEHITPLLEILVFLFFAIGLIDLIRAFH